MARACVARAGRCSERFARGDDLRVHVIATGKRPKAAACPCHTISLLALLLFLLAGCCAKAPTPPTPPPPPPVELSRFEFLNPKEQPQMGTQFQIIIYAPAADEAAAREAAARGFARIDELNATLSDYDRTSELSRLGDAAGNGQWIKVSDDLWNVLRISDDYARQSGGAFDITVGPAVQLWRWARRNGQMPSAARLKAAVDAVGHEKIEFDPANQAVRLTAPNMRLDAGGIGKGYACDEVLKILKARGYRQVMINGGGGVVVGDPPPGRKGWRIGIASLDPRNVPPSKYVVFSNAAMSTSGDAWQFVELDGKRYSHIVDAKTGLGLTDHYSVSIVAPTGTLSDVLSTTVAVLGPEKGMAFVDQIEGVAAFIVRKKGEKVEVFESKGVKKLTLEDPVE